MFPPGIEPGTFCVLGRRDNRYTTETLTYVSVFFKWNVTRNNIYYSNTALKIRELSASAVIV